MPAFNEGGCIYDNIRLTGNILAEAGISAEILAVDDGSSDNTLAEIERAAKAFESVRVVRNPYNMGKGMALRSGFEHSTGEIVVFLDADLDLHPSQIQTLLAALEEGPYDIVVTSKHHPQSQLEYPLSREIASWIYFMFIKILFNLPVRDTQTGLKVFRRKVLDDVFHRLLVKKFAYDIELLAVAVRFGYRVKEVPVILNFKRELKWGRIRFPDVMSLFIDTLAIFYRLRILRYYDMKRPSLPIRFPRVLVIIQGCPPSEDVIKRLIFEGNVRIACLGKVCGFGEKMEEILFFDSEDALRNWMKTRGSEVEIIGMLSAQCLPLGNWVKNAVRNFQDPGIDIVSGPVIPGPFATFFERMAGMVFPTPLTRGTDNRLYSYKPMRIAQKGLSGNIFLRLSLFLEEQAGDDYLSWVKGFVLDRNNSGRMRYDPDVAVSKPVPPLFFPYMRMVFSMAFDEGFFFFGRYGSGNRFWEAFPTGMALLILIGWLALPAPLYGGIVALYLIMIITAGLFTFSLSSAPPVMLGILCDHAARAVGFPAGILAKVKEKLLAADYPDKDG
jgi:glycosyltransferase involved in cell wall biosynthesis